MRFCWRLRALRQGQTMPLAKWQSQLMVCLELCRRNAEARRLITMNLGGQRDHDGERRASDASARRADRMSRTFLSFRPKARASKAVRLSRATGDRATNEEPETTAPEPATAGSSSPSSPSPAKRRSMFGGGAAFGSG